MQFYPAFARSTAATIITTTITATARRIVAIDLYVGFIFLGANTCSNQEAVSIVLIKGVVGDKVLAHVA